MGTFLCLPQVEFRTADNHFMAMFHEQANQVLQAQQAGASVHQSDIIDIERALQFGHLEQLIQYDTCIGVTFHIDDDTHAFAVGFVIDI